MYENFVVDGFNQKQSIGSMPGVYRYSIDLLVDEVKNAYDLGISSIAIFPHIKSDLKTPDCAEAVNPDNLLCRAVREIKLGLFHPERVIAWELGLDSYQIPYQNPEI